MLLADDGSGTRIQASPGAAGWCPTCKEPLIPKCGEFVIWHWSHRAGTDCDAWAEGESPWHAAWKAEFKPEQTEVPVGPHRADILVGHTVIELQHSTLEPAQVREREMFYRREVGNLVWIVDMTDVDIAFHEPRRANQRFRMFHWSRPKKWLAECTAPVFWDVGDGVMFHMLQLKIAGQSLLVRRISGSTNGTGRFGTKDEFLAHYRDRPIQEQLMEAR